MQKPVDSLDYWKERIKTAQKEQYSVYVITDDAWERIHQIHKRVIEEVVGGTVLDAGCGYGRLSEFFDKKRYTGIDFSPDFIARAQEKYPDKTFQVANLKALPFHDKQFDWVICASIKQMIEANLGEDVWQEMEKEARRVGKKVLILEYGEPERYVII